MQRVTTTSMTRQQTSIQIMSFCTNDGISHQLFHTLGDDQYLPWELPPPGLLWQLRQGAGKGDVQTSIQV